MSRRVPDWIDVKQDSPVGFTIVIASRDIERCMCHCADNKGIYFNDDCRPCQINKGIYESELQWHREEDNNTYMVKLTGRAENDAQKIAFTRLMALLKGHIEPLTLVEARQRGFRV